MSSSDNNGSGNDSTDAEANNWKSVGNRHMAAKEYDAAYNAYSTAISLSPLGPYSHIFLSNRAAALLSLKKYSAASVDARRAITLAPTFGKAHARLGQSLYFLKDYAGAVAAYENAFQFEPDNTVTWTYLNKAKKKFARENDRRRRKEEEDLDERVRVEKEQQISHGYGGRDSPQDDHNVNNYDHNSNYGSTAGDGHSVTDTVDLANMAINVADSDAQGRSVGVLGPDDEDGQLREYQGTTSNAVQAAIGHKSYVDESEEQDNEDPDFEEALRLQETASIKLSKKEYRRAVEEFSAALFLVPDDDNLTPQLYVGRAHALNGQQRHEGALNDAMMALGRNPEYADAHIVLARSYFYLKDWNEAVQSFENGRDCLLGTGGNLTPLDTLYLEKAMEYLELASIDGDGTNIDDLQSVRSQAFSVSRQSSKPVPKLKPPRFVSRAELLTSTVNVPPMPKAWRKNNSSNSNLKLPQLPTTLKVGQERKVTFMSEQMGVKLNRGPDGIIRVLAVNARSTSYEKSKIIREGNIAPGDILREAAGVDLRRPLTNIMWSDTVALLKISPRPLIVIVAKELSARPHAAQEEFVRAQKEALRQNDVIDKTPKSQRRISPLSPPSCANGEEEIAQTAVMIDTMEKEIEVIEGKESSLEPCDDSQGENRSISENDSIKQGANDDNNDEEYDGALNPCCEITSEIAEQIGNSLQDEESFREDPDTSTRINGSDGNFDEVTMDGVSSSSGVDKESDQNVKLLPQSGQDGNNAVGGDGPRQDDARDQAQHKSGLKIIFPRPKSAASRSNLVQGGLTNQAWQETENTRRLLFCGEVCRFEKARFFWASGQFIRRTLALFENPDVLVIARTPTNGAEVRGSLRELGIADELKSLSDEELVKTYLMLESLIDLQTCKLRLSTLTTPTSLFVDRDSSESDLNHDTEMSINPKQLSCFELITPNENILITAMKNADSDIEANASQDDNTGATFAITSRWEAEISNALMSAHGVKDDEDKGLELTWRHQMILGTLHSHVVSGNFSLLELSLKGKGSPLKPYVDIDARDQSGLTALHYACLRRSSKALSILLNAGADCSLPTIKYRNSPSHLCAENLDEKCLSIILCRADPNALNEKLETPMLVALTNGKSLHGKKDPALLQMCLKSLEAWGGQLAIPSAGNLRGTHPVHDLAEKWDSKSLEIIFDFCNHRYPIAGEGTEGYGRSLAAIYQYPLHTSLLVLRKKISGISDDGIYRFGTRDKVEVANTLEVLLNKGFEPNERIEIFSTHIPEINEMSGFSPIQVLAAAALDLIEKAQSLEQKETNMDLQCATEILANCAELLVRKGAHVFSDVPVADRPHRGPPKKNVVSEEITQAKVRIFRHIERSSINMEKNKKILPILGGADRLAVAKARWQNTKSVNGCDQPFLKGKGASIKVLNCLLPGGSDEKNCAICWRKFGPLINRKHVCRASKRYICDHCSGKTVIIDGDPRRISDGQFNLAKFDFETKLEKNSRRLTEQRKERKARIEKAQAARSATYQNRLKATERDEAAAKEDLFGNVGKAVKNFFMEEVGVEDDSAPANAQSNVAGVMSALGETRQAFDERGQKLNNLVEKTAALNSASEDFAKMAKELRESQERGIFW